MRPHYDGQGVTLWHGDCLDVLATLPDASVDAVVTDPPYGLEFMGREWDSFGGDRRQPFLGEIQTPDNPYGRSTVRFAGSASYGARVDGMRAFQQWCEQWAAQCLRVLKPGGMFVAFGGTRTFHRLACAAEDAGFEIRDSIAWIHAQGFPKSRNITKELESLPACSCGSEVSHDGSRVIDTAGPPGAVGAGAGAEARAVAFAGLPTNATGRVGPQVVPAASLGVADMDALNEHRVGKGLPVVLGPAAVTGAADGEQVLDGVSRVEVDPEALRDEVVGEEAVDRATVGAGAVALDHSGGDVSPTAPLVLPLPTTPRGVSGSGLPLAVPDSHARLGAVDGGVGPPPELSPANGADVDAVSGALHGQQFTAERLGRCEACGGVRGPIPQGLGTAMKPAFEPIVVARKPLAGTVAANVQAWGTGALNIDATRIEGEERKPVTGFANRNLLKRNAQANDRPWMLAADPDASGAVQPHPAGRWPANVIFDETQAARLDEQSGERPGAVSNGSKTAEGMNGTDTFRIHAREQVPGYGDTGGASRFFFVAKADASERPRTNGAAHPTVKPLALMRHLVRLVTPPGGTVLEPFAGSGTTVEACLLEGFRCIAIEKTDEYLPLVLARIHRQRDPVQAIKLAGEPLGLFDFGTEETA